MKILNYKYIFLLLVLLGTLFSVQGQPQRGARITNEGVEVKAPNKLAILDLDSAEKGFLLPRMSTVQRDEIQINKQANNGLAIFNTTTDCIEYFNQSLDMWVSLCGDALPAEFSILDMQCDEIKILGGYFKGRQLNQTNGILLKVSVAAAGTYSIYADSHNGYSFSAQGKFPDVGIYTILLKAEGKPQIGYNPNEVGDEIKFQLNGVISSCVKHIKVENDVPLYTFIANSRKQFGNFFFQEDMSSDEYVTVGVNVTRTGKWVVQSKAVEGVRFEGEGLFSQLGDQTIRLEAIGRPQKEGNTNIVLIGNPEFGTTTQQKTFNTSYSTLGVSYAIEDCASVKYSEEAYLATLLSQNATMTVNVNVLAPGSTNIIATSTTNNGESVVFESGTTLLKYDRSKAVNTQSVVLKVKNTNRMPGISGNLAMTMSGKGQTKSCNITMPVKTRTPVWQAIDAKLVSKFNYKEMPYITPRTNMGATGSNDFKLEVKVTATTGGEVNIETNNVNGINFKGKGLVFPGRENIISLKAYGKSEGDMKTEDAKFTIAGSTNAKAYNFNLDFVYRPMNLMGFGANTPNVYSLASGNNDHANFANGMLKNETLLGWNGIVRIAEFNLLDQNGIYLSAINDAVANNRFQPILDKTDILIISGIALKSRPRLTDIATATKNDKKLVTIYAETGKVGSEEYYNHMLHFSYQYGERLVSDKLYLAVNSNFSNLIEPDFLNSNSTLLTSRFFKDKAEMQKAFFGAHSTGDKVDQVMFSFSSASINRSKFKPLFRHSRPDKGVYYTVGLIHESLGVILLGINSPFVGSQNSNYSTYNLVSPLVTTGSPGDKNNEPAIRRRYGTSTLPLDQYNSYHLLNMMYWAIDYAQENQPNVIKPK